MRARAGGAGRGAPGSARRRRPLQPPAPRRRRAAGPAGTGTAGGGKFHLGHLQSRAQQQQQQAPHASRQGPGFIGLCLGHAKAHLVVGAQRVAEAPDALQLRLQVRRDLLGVGLRVGVGPCVWVVWMVSRANGMRGLWCVALPSLAGGQPPPACAPARSAASISDNSSLAPATPSRSADSWPGFASASHSLPCGRAGGGAMCV